jgi:hypothetical protein
MHSIEIKNRFIELRAQGYSLPRISDALSVPISTLSDWQAQHRHRIERLKAEVIEEIEHSILGAAATQAEMLVEKIDLIEKVITQKFQSDELRTCSLRELIWISGRLRGNLARLHPKISAGPLRLVPEATETAPTEDTVDSKP